MRQRSQLQLSILAAVPFIMVLGNSMLIPVLPRIRSALSLTTVQTGLMITAFSLTAGLTIPITGFLSDRIGRKQVMVPALFVYGLGGLMAGIFSITIKNSYIWIMASRMVQGVGAGGTYQLAMALAADVFPADQRTKVLGILEAGNGLGKVISPLAGAAVMLIVWYAPFFVYGALAIPVGILVWTLVIQAPPKEGNRKISKYLDTLRSIWSNRGAALLGCFAAGFIVLFMLFGLLADFSDVLEDKFMLKSFSKGLVIAVPVFIMTLTAYITGLLLQRKSSLLLKNVVGIGLGLEAGSILLLSFLNGLWLIVGAFSMAGAGSGLVLPSLNTLITSSAEKDERGLITALYGSMRFFGAAFGPPAFGLAVVLGKRWMFWGAAAITLLTSVVMLYFVDARRLAFDKAGSSKVEKANADTNTNGECDCHKIDDIW